MPPLSKSNESLNTAPQVLSGFEHINRYWDKHALTFAAKILPGEYYVTQHKEKIVTVLGSCVSACIRDKNTGVGGMNHFMLPETSGDGSWGGSNVNTAATRYGNYAMEHMINDIIKFGGKRGNLEVKVCGGGKILKQMTDIGNRNINFVRDYLHTEGYLITSEDLGDIYPRKVEYFPMSGKMRIKKLLALKNDTVIRREEEYQHQLEDEPVSGEIELF